MTEDSSTIIVSLLCCLVPHRAHTAVPEVQIIWQRCHHVKEMQVPPSGVLITMTPAHNQEAKQSVTSKQVKWDVFFFSFQMTGGPSQCPERATQSPLNQQTTNVSSERLMARRKLAQWWAYCASYVYLTFLNVFFFFYAVNAEFLLSNCRSAPKK